MIDSETLKEEIDKCIYKVNLHLSFCEAYALKKQLDLSWQYLLNAQHELQKLEGFYP